MSRETGALWYFAYGSNMSRAIFRERRGMRPLEAYPAWLDGYRLCFNIPVGPGERGVANVMQETGARTHGVAYHLTAADFDRLDATEGVPAGLYRRIPVTVVTDRNERIDSWTYQSSLIADERKPSARYLQLLLDGVREHGLPATYEQFLLNLERAWDERLGPAPTDRDQS